MKKYEQTLNQLKKVLNSSRSKKGFNIGFEFKAILKSLNDDFKQQVSTKFLRDLIDLNKLNRYKSHRVKYLISKAGLKTERQNKYKFDWIYQKWNTEITEYEHKKDGLIYTGFPRGLFNEEMILKDEEKLNRRNAINKGGGVFIKDVRMQGVSRFFKGNTKQVFFMVTGF